MSSVTFLFSAFFVAQIFLFFFKKPIDKSIAVMYNVSINTAL